MTTAFKYSMIFVYQSNITADNPTPQRIGGFSESYYADANDTPTYTKFLTLIQKRLGMCPRGMSVNKVRVQQVDPAGPASLTKVSYSAPDTWLSDVPQMALKVPIFLDTAKGQVIRIFRGIPDVMVTAGEYTPTTPFVAAVKAFTDQLKADGWKLRRRDKSKPFYAINSISAGGVVVMIDPTVAVGQGTNVQVYRTIRAGSGRRYGYFAKVGAFTDTTHFTLASPKVVESTFGKLRVAETVYHAFNQFQTAEYTVVVKKIGRPSREYSGRASKRQ